MRRSPARSTGTVLLVAVLVLAVTAGAAVGGYFAAEQVRLPRTGSGRPPPLPTSSALAAATNAPPPTAPPSNPPTPSATGVSLALAPKLADPGLGSHVLAYVADAATGLPLYDHLGSAAAAPASTAKLLTAAALLSVRSPAYRITTKVVAGSAPGTVVIVGGGDPTLTAATGTQPGAFANAARITDLAAQLRAAHVQVTGVVVDDSLFTGPTVSPQWSAQDVPSDYAAPITALMADAGGTGPGNPIRSTSSDLNVGRDLVAALGASNVPIVRGTAAAGAPTLASVQSPPLSELIGQMLQQSDNVIAECLARQVVLARSAAAGSAGPAQAVSFTGAATSIRAVLAGLGADPGPGLSDGSGLAASDRLSAAGLVAVLRLIVGDAHPLLHEVITALPVAAWSGTLTDRYLTGSPSAAGAGMVRAKTGTLSGVSALAGTVHDAAGRLLVFAVIADAVAASSAGTAAAEAALDAVAATLAGCGCN
ncbi:MAG: D-alanyl-D-alanine carboxypeptidase/D-alanyl-D-alanine-endopeptidase [Actinomycetota bacterium]|nr:D-alanyl-D-alanine carboxypeptidase/D-alanyl-D-alanine-endopeptidase [Actinomycetota bacterium]